MNDRPDPDSVTTPEPISIGSDPRFNIVYFGPVTNATILPPQVLKSRTREGARQRALTGMKTEGRTLPGEARPAHWSDLVRLGKRRDKTEAGAGEESPAAMTRPSALPNTFGRAHICGRARSTSFA